VVDTGVQIESLPPVLVFLVRADAGYDPKRNWGDFDALGGRAVQDLCFVEEANPETSVPSSVQRVLYAFSAEPPHAADVVAVSLPLQLALEIAFFHIAEIDRLVLNPRVDRTQSPLSHAALQQQELEFSIPDDFEPTQSISRQELPALIGALIAQSDQQRPKRKGLKSDLLGSAAKALRAGAYFECFYLARRARFEDRFAGDSGSPGREAKQAWFYELFALSFFGSADQALLLYEQYPERGSSDPQAQLLAARYRLLLKQFNEARTILHTLSFNSELGALASTELARSYLIEKHFGRALDAANAALQKDSSLSEGYLLRGIALRGSAYEAGDVDGLKEAYADFERVAKQGGYGAAEALYHAGTVCARLGLLAQAETAFRQSLFQRDRVTARDALIRILCAQDKRSEAIKELNVLERLAPSYGRKLRVDLGSAVQESQRAKSDAPTEVRESADLWSMNIDASVGAARALLRSWQVPLEGVPTDCVVLDDLINRFAPDGDFPTQGRFSVMAFVGHEVVARALALHIGEILVSMGVAVWGADHAKQCTVRSTRMEIEIPVESFVTERILLGASGDNFSSLESLVMELQVLNPGRGPVFSADWWTSATPERVEEIAAEVSWISDLLRDCQIDLVGGLVDLEVLDLWIESVFEPGGSIKDQVNDRIPSGLLGQRDSLDDQQFMARFIAGLGLLVGQRIADAVSGRSGTPVSGVWYDHEKPEGLSIWNFDLGRVFPVARLQRRVYLASAADFSSKLSSLAWSVAVASVTGAVRSGKLVGEEAVRGALVAALPSIAAFPEAELSGVVNSLLIGASI
jgi:tetratricopeptide (TPR) repeat protein